MVLYFLCINRFFPQGSEDGFNGRCDTHQSAHMPVFLDRMDGCIWIVGFDPLSINFWYGCILGRSKNQHAPLPAIWAAGIQADIGKVIDSGKLSCQEDLLGDGVGVQVGVVAFPKIFLLFNVISDGSHGIGAIAPGNSLGRSDRSCQTFMALLTPLALSSSDDDPAVKFPSCKRQEPDLLIGG
jgi:hypothetical protein